jgi:putative flippase GtrA
VIADSKPEKSTRTGSLLLANQRRRIPAFVAVGSIGFLIEATILGLMTHWANWTPWHARIPSFLVAVSVTWMLNRRHTFNTSRVRMPWVEALTYGTIQTCGAAVNLGVFGLCLHYLPRLSAFPLIPFAIGAAIAMGFNFAALSMFIYPSHATAHDPKRSIRIS